MELKEEKETQKIEIVNQCTEEYVNFENGINFNESVETLKQTEKKQDKTIILKMSILPSLLECINTGLVPRLGWGKRLKYHDNSIVRDEILPYVPRMKRIKFLYSLSRSARLFLARYFNRIRSPCIGVWDPND